MISGLTALQIHGLAEEYIQKVDVDRLDPKGSMFFKALKRYCSKGHVDSTAIAQYDQILKTQVLMHLRQELADG